MILGRPTNLIVGAFQALLGAFVIIGANLVPPINIAPAVVGAVVLAFGALIALIANQPATVNAGDTVKIVTPTPSGAPNILTTMTAPAAPTAPKAP